MSVFWVGLFTSESINLYLCAICRPFRLPRRILLLFFNYCKIIGGEIKNPETWTVLQQALTISPIGALKLIKIN